jgi:hypothetical protein
MNGILLFRRREREPQLNLSHDGLVVRVLVYLCRITDW